MKGYTKTMGGKKEVFRQAKVRERRMRDMENAICPKAEEVKALKEESTVKER